MSEEDALTPMRTGTARKNSFETDKSYPRAKIERVYGSKVVDTKSVIEFVALIINNQIYKRLKEETIKKRQRAKYHDGSGSTEGTGKSK